MNEPQKLPIGIQTFEEIIREGYIYVDKTKHFVDLIDRGKVYFLSRPRRFGKSLTVSTFDAIFSGKRELFKGLAAEEFFSRPGYRPNPVVKLDMSAASAKNGLDEFNAAILDQLEWTASKYNVRFERTSPGRAFSKLLRDLCQAAGHVAVLIDEYDKPVLDFIDEPETASKIRDALRDFYIQIKASDEYTRFVFLTGISKFSKTGVFSGMNNLEDISMHARHSAMLGYTEEELRHYFGGHISETSQAMGIPEEELLTRMRDYYDGFSFDGDTRLYIPFSTLMFFSAKRFGNFWFDSGTPSFIAKFMKDRKLTVDEFRGMNVSLGFASSPGEIESASPAGFLYQSGYLTLRPGTSDDYFLDYPNREVLVSMSALQTAAFLGSKELSEVSASHMKTALADGSADILVREFNRLLAKIPYDDYAPASSDIFEARHPEASFGEWLYRSALLSCLHGAGVSVEAELHGHRGRPDIVAEHGGRAWVLEFKIRRKGGDAGKLADEALEQIKSKGYGERYENPILLGLAIDDEKRGITEYRAG
jgi:hypothetical protein